MSFFDSQKYDIAKQFANNFFIKNKVIKSASLGNVYLNSDGFLHLIFKNGRHKRDWKNQVKRFYLLEYVKPVLEGLKFYQEYIETFGKTSKDFKIIKFWGFVAVINNRIRIKLILKKTGDGNIIFWSVIPYWKTRFYKDIKITILHKGDPDEE